MKWSAFTSIVSTCGLPGAGKTTYAKGLLEAGRVVGYCDDHQSGPSRRMNHSFTNDDKRLLAG